MMSPYWNSLSATGFATFLLAPPALFFAPETEGRATFFLGLAPATVEEGLVLEEDLGADASSPWAWSTAGATSSDDICDGF